MSEDIEAHIRGCVQGEPVWAPNRGPISLLLWPVVSCSCPVALLPPLPLFAIPCSRFMLYRISGHRNLIDDHSYALVTTFASVQQTLYVDCHRPAHTISC
jgi:hypothetical protein